MKDYLVLKENDYLHGANIIIDEIIDFLRSTGKSVDVKTLFNDYRKKDNLEEYLSKQEISGKYEKIILNDFLSISSLKYFSTYFPNLNYDEAILFTHNSLNLYLNSFSKEIAEDFVDSVNLDKTKLLLTLEIQKQEYQDYLHIKDEQIVTWYLPIKANKNLINKNNEKISITFNSARYRMRVKGADRITEIALKLCKNYGDKININVLDSFYGVSKQLDKLKDEYPNIVTLNARKSHEETLKLLGESDIFVSTSRYEATHIAMIEALMLNNSIITFPTDGAIDFFGYDRYTISNDINDAYDKIEYYFDENNRNKQINKFKNNLLKFDYDKQLKSFQQI